MHELSIAKSLKNELEKIAGERNIKNIISVTLVIGELSGVDEESLSFVMPFVCEKTILEGVNFIYEKEAVEIECNQCGHSNKVELPVIKCKDCNSGDVKIVAGQTLTIKNMEVE